MARKKKSKKKSDPEKASGAAAEESSGNADGEGKGSTSKQKSSSGKKKSSKKKSSKKKTPRKKQARKKATEKAEPAAEEDDEPEVEEEAEAESPADATATADEPEEEAPVEDLDAVLDEDVDGTEDLDELIAATVAVATSPDDVEEPAAESPGEPVAATPDGEPRTGPSAEAEDAAAEAGVSVTAASDAADESEGAAGADATGTATDAAALPPPSGEDLAGAIDLGDVSSPEVRDRLLAAAMAHAEMQDARYRVPFSDPRSAGRWKGAVATALLLVALVALVAPPAWVRPEPPAQIGAAERARGLRRALLLQAQQVDAYRVRRQRLPDTLEELPDPLPGVRYVRSGSRAFQLIAYEPDGNALVYDSTDPAPEFDGLTPAWISGDSP